MANLQRNFAEISPPLPNCVPTYFLSLNLILTPRPNFFDLPICFPRNQVSVFWPKNIETECCDGPQMRNTPEDPGGGCLSHLAFTMAWILSLWGSGFVSQHPFRISTWRYFYSFERLPVSSFSKTIYGMLWAPSGACPFFLRLTATQLARLKPGPEIEKSKCSVVSVFYESRLPINYVSGFPENVGWGGGSALPWNREIKVNADRL